MDTIKLVQIDLTNSQDTRFLFETRSHPEICKYLLGNPPVSYEAHMGWLKANVPEKRKMFLLKKGDVCLGYCHAYDFIGKDTVEVGFVVHPDHQRKGYGDQMVKEIVLWLRENMSDRKIILYVRMGNDRASLLYQKHGFEAKAQVQDSVLYELDDSRVSGLNVAFAHCGQNAMMLRWAIGYLSAALKDEGANSEVVDLSSVVGKKRCNDADVIVFYRSLDNDSLDFIKSMRMKGKVIVYFIDDYIFQPNCKYAPNYEHVVRQFFLAADIIVSSSQKLLDKAPDGKSKILRRSVIDRDTFQLLCPEEFSPDDSGTYTIGWIAGIGRKEMNGFVKNVVACLEREMNEYEKIRFVCFGDHGLKGFKRVEIQELAYSPPSEWKALYQRFRSCRFNVVINPLDERDEFCQCKSELKYVETGALMVPIVTSRVCPFTEVIRDGENGFLASTPEEFAEKALQVCRNLELAKRVALTANAHVRGDYDSVRNARKFAVDVYNSKRYFNIRMAEEKKRKELEILKEKLNSLDVFDSEVIGPIEYGMSCEMSIPLMLTCRVYGFSVFGATYCKAVRKGASYQVWLNGVKVRDGAFSPSVMLDNQWWGVHFERMMVKQGDTLSFRIINMDGAASLGFYQCKDKSIGRSRKGTEQMPPMAVRLEKGP